MIGDVHTNTIEGFWSLVKRGIGGVYHSVSKKYLQTYLNEYAFRYNHRDCGNLIFPSARGSGFTNGVAEAFRTSRKKSSRVNVAFLFVFVLLIVRPF